jgi:hypothetical protein
MGAVQAALYAWFADRLQRGRVLRVNQCEQKQNSVPVVAYDSIPESYRCSCETCEYTEQRHTQERKQYQCAFAVSSPPASAFAVSSPPAASTPLQKEHRQHSMANMAHADVLDRDRRECGTAEGSTPFLLHSGAPWNPRVRFAQELQSEGLWSAQVSCANHCDHAITRFCLRSAMPGHTVINCFNVYADYAGSGKQT